MIKSSEHFVCSDRMWFLYMHFSIRGVCTFPVTPLSPKFRQWNRVCYTLAWCGWKCYRGLITYVRLLDFNYPIFVFCFCSYFAGQADCALKLQPSTELKYPKDWESSSRFTRFITIQRSGGNQRSSTLTGTETEGWIPKLLQRTQDAPERVYPLGAERTNSIF